MRTLSDVLSDMWRWMRTRESKWLFCVLITVSYHMSKDDLADVERFIHALKDNR